MGSEAAIILSGSMAGHLTHAWLADMSIHAFRGNAEGNRGNRLKRGQQKEECGDRTHSSKLSRVTLIA